MKTYKFINQESTLVAVIDEDSKSRVSGTIDIVPEGFAVIAFEPPQASIVSVDAGQIRRALTRVGLRAPLEAAIANGTQDLKDYYQYSNMFVRTHPLVIEMGATLGASSNDLDNLWLLAATL